MKLSEYRNKLEQNPEYIAVKKELKPYFILANNVLALRLMKGWTQKDLADKTKTKQANISKIEAGLSNPSIKFLIKLAKALDVDIVDLLEEHSSSKDIVSSSTKQIDNASNDEAISVPNWPGQEQTQIDINDPSKSAVNTKRIEL